MSSISLNSFLSTALSNSISELRTQIADRAQEATTGRQSDLISHLNGRIFLFHSFKNLLNRTFAWVLL